MNLSDRPALVYLRGQGEASWTSHLVPESPLRMTPAGLECAVEDAWRECERQGRRGLLVLGDEVPTRAAWVQALRADAGDPLLVADLGEASLVDRVLGTLREDATARLLVTGSLDQEEPATRLAPLLLELQLVPEPDPMSSRPPRDVPHPPPNLVDVPGGRFPMGSPLTEPERWADEGPVHVVDVRPFRMARHPVTRAEFAAFLAAVTDEPLPRYWVDPR